VTADLGRLTVGRVAHPDTGVVRRRRRLVVGTTSRYHTHTHTHTAHDVEDDDDTPLKNTSKHTCSDSLNLKPPAPPYPLQDFKALYKCCNIIIIIFYTPGSKDPRG